MNDYSSLAVQYKRGDKGAGDKLIERMDGVVANVIRSLRLISSGIETSKHGAFVMEDLMQQGRMGVVFAADRYDPERGVPFEKYAYHWIRKMVLEFINTDNRPIRLPKHVYEAYYYSDERDETSDAAHTVKSTEVYSFEASTSDERSPEDVLAAEDEELLENMILENKVGLMLADLGPRERTILRMRFGVDRPPRTLKEIARVLGISHEMVRKVENEALGRLRGRRISFKEV